MKPSSRKQAILAAVIRSYIITGEPVGSKNLRESEDLNLSPATIRAEMSDLCEMGLLVQPHTSAGRIPTALGYRFYIEELMNHYQLTDADKKLIDDMLPLNIKEPEKIIESAAEALAVLTNHTVLLTTPADRDAVVRKIQLIKLGRCTVMIILITSTGMIKNCISRADYDINIAMLEKIDNVLKIHVYGMPIDSFNTAFAQRIINMLGADSLSTTPLIVSLMDLINDISEEGLRLKGESNLLIHPDFTPEQARNILDYISSQSILPLLSNAKDGIIIVLGNETGEEALLSSGVIAARYRLGLKEVGSIGIVGPERMDYEHIIPSILYFRDNLGKLLSQSYIDDDY